MATGSLFIEGNIRVPSNVYDLNGFRRWVHSDSYPEHGRFAYLAGEVCFNMSPEELETHNKLKRAVTRFLDIWVDSNDVGEILADGALLVNEAADLSCEPDVTFCSWESLESGRVKYLEAVEGSERYVEVVGGPDLVVEVISRSSVYKDTQALPPLYFAAGVLEYWLIDARGGEIDFRLKARGDAGWRDVEPDGDGFYQSDVLGGKFRLIRELNRVGGFRYELLSKSL
ncbi:MAG: Uma2 family endonuclease [Planctomycetota bacterium]